MFLRKCAISIVPVYNAGALDYNETIFGFSLSSFISMKC